MNRQFVTYGFPAAAIEPGGVFETQVNLNGMFCGSRLALAGFMQEIRGHFRIRHTKLRLNRETVIAYSNVTRNKKKRRTTVEYRENATGNFVRQYLPENVVYVSTDPLSYVTLDQFLCGKTNALSNVPTTQGVPVQHFNEAAFGTGIPLPTSDTCIKLAFKNHGDIRVRVFAAIMGTEAARLTDRRPESKGTTVSDESSK